MMRVRVCDDPMPDPKAEALAHRSALASAPKPIQPRPPSSNSPF